MFPLMGVILFMVYRVAMKSQDFHMRRDRYILKIPIIGVLNENRFWPILLGLCLCC